MTKWSHLETQDILSSCHKAKKLTSSLPGAGPCHPHGKRVLLPALAVEPLSGL